MPVETGRAPSLRRNRAQYLPANQRFKCDKKSHVPCFINKTQRSKKTLRLTTYAQKRYISLSHFEFLCVFYCQTMLDLKIQRIQKLGLQLAYADRWFPTTNPSFCMKLMIIYPRGHGFGSCRDGARPIAVKLRF